MASQRVIRPRSQKLTKIRISLKTRATNDKNATCVRIFLSSSNLVWKVVPCDTFYLKKSKLEVDQVGPARKRDEVLQLFFDKETDVPLASFSDQDLSECKESNESDDDDHGRLPDGEAGDHGGAGNPIFLEGAENQARMMSAATTATILKNLDIFHQRSMKLSFEFPNV